MTDRLLTIREVQDRLSAPRTRVFELLKAGRLRRLKLGGRTRISEKDLIVFIKELKK